MTYNAHSIEQLDALTAFRTKVGMYLGSANNEGVKNGLIEIISNSTDEALVGYGKDIYIEISEKWASVRDSGRGIPRGKNDKSEEVLITLLTESHSGGKFNKESYGKSRGLHGIGASATCATSDWFEVETKRDGFVWTLRFENGIPMTSVAVKGEATKETGTFMKWQPSQEVFKAEPIKFNYEQICATVEDYSFFNAGVRFIVKNVDTGEEKIFYSKNGLLDFAESRIHKAIHDTPVTYKTSVDGIDLEIVAKWTSGREECYLFVNGAECPDGGTPVTGAKTAITRTINTLTGKKFSGDLIRKGLVYIIDIKHPDPQFSNQIKTKIGNSELSGICSAAFNTALKEFASKNTKEFENIFEVLTKTEKAEKAAEKAREAIMSATKEINATSKKKVFASDKLKDALQLGQESVLILTEGDSAASTIRKARDPRTYGILALRGKVISALTNPMEKVLDNEEVRLIISALGLSLKNYQAKSLRYGKIAIATDADADGANIANLVTTLFYVLFPEILKEGRLYRFYSPLYKIEKGKSITYCYTEEEYQALSNKSGATIERWKG